MVVRYQKVQNLGLWRKKVKEMIDSAMSAKDARYMLGLWHSGGSISSSQLAKGYTYIKEVWN